MALIFDFLTDFCILEMFEHNGIKCDQFRRERRSREYFISEREFHKKSDFWSISPPHGPHHDLQFLVMFYSTKLTNFCDLEFCCADSVTYCMWFRQFSRPSDTEQPPPSTPEFEGTSGMFEGCTKETHFRNFLLILFQNLSRWWIPLFKISWRTLGLMRRNPRTDPQGRT